MINMHSIDYGYPTSTYGGKNGGYFVAFTTLKTTKKVSPLFETRAEAEEYFYQNFAPLPLRPDFKPA